MNKSLRIGIGAIISAVCLWYVFRGFNPHDLKLALANANYIWSIPFFLLYVINQMVRTLRWKVLLTPIKLVSVPSLFPVLMVGFFMNLILPARGGEFVRAYAAHRRFDVNAISTFGSIVAERFSDLFGLLLIIALACRVLPVERVPLTQIGAAFMIGAFVIFGLLAFLKKNGGRTDQLTGFKKIIFEFLQNSVKGFMALRSGKLIFFVGLLSVCVWINETLMVLLISKVMNLPLSFFQCCAVLVGLCVGVMIPAAPGFIGTFEFFGKQALLLMGFAAIESLNYVLALHFAQVIAVSSVGILSMLFLKKKALNS